MSSYANVLIETYVKRVKANILEAESDVASGAAGDYPDYKRRCGEINGLRMAIDHLVKTIKDMESA